MRASMVTDLPEPDSPTMASTSPCSTDRSRASTTGGASASPKRTDRLRISSRLMSGGTLEFRVEGVAQAIAHQVDRLYREQNGEAGQADHPPGALDIVARRGEHGAPFGRR